ncbi:hypothetical protein ACYOEI_40020 [Singulisphaera rosea]
MKFQPMQGPGGQVADRPDPALLNGAIAEALRSAHGGRLAWKRPRGGVRGLLFSVTIPVA